MTGISINIKKPFPIALSIGSLCGVAIIITTIVTSKGPAIFISYTALLIATFVVLRAGNFSSFSKRFTTSFLAFMIATIIMYLYIGFFDAGTILEIPVLGHIWRLGFFATIGGILSGTVAYFTDNSRK
jgi:hypothetical protein